MSVSIGDYYTDYYTKSSVGNATEAKLSSLESKLGTVSAENSSDEELMTACKEFEAYLVEQVVKQMKEAFTESEEDSTGYMQVFGDTMVQDIASTISENTELGIAQQLFESMKRNVPSLNITEAVEDTGNTGAENTSFNVDNLNAEEAAGSMTTHLERKSGQVEDTEPEQKVMPVQTFQAL